MPSLAGGNISEEVRMTVFLASSLNSIMIASNELADTVSSPSRRSGESIMRRISPCDLSEAVATAILVFQFSTMRDFLCDGCHSVSSSESRMHSLPA